MLRWLIPGFLLVSLLGGPLRAGAPGGERVETRTLALASGSNLRVINRNGWIRVAAWDRDVVDVEAVIRDTGRRKAELVVRQQDRDLELEIKMAEGAWLSLGSSRAPRCQLTLRVPRRLSAAFRTLNGDIQVEGIEGFADCNTTNGDISVAGLKGEVHCETTNGRILARDLKARFRGESTHGSIRIASVEGGIKAETTHGSIRAEELDGWGEGIFLETTHGDIEVILGRATGELTAENTVGTLDIRPAAARGVVAAGRSHELRVQIGTGRQPIRLETTHGSIRVR